MSVCENQTHKFVTVTKETDWLLLGTAAVTGSCQLAFERKYFLHELLLIF